MTTLNEHSSDLAEYVRMKVFKKHNPVPLIYSCRAITTGSGFVRFYTITKKSVYIPLNDIEYMIVVSEGLISNLEIDTHLHTWKVK